MERESERETAGKRQKEKERESEREMEMGRALVWWLGVAAALIHLHGSFFITPVWSDVKEGDLLSVMGESALDVPHTHSLGYCV